ncbi:translation factor GUF1, mitochondrial [Puccinia sorghi]|uniref:Translation factor GUF1, mitochondrial n=1 Tax=Puccinia sorghi TaxID=27349 RepID=A0A0L6VQL4_9BASI|nr:translation factor GUF1, mitochondrial [Puccinia sorghi]
MVACERCVRRAGHEAEPWLAEPSGTEQKMIGTTRTATARVIRIRTRIRHERLFSLSVSVSASAPSSSELTTPINLSGFTPDLIRSFSIIAHIDHGKSTLSDRLLELTRTIPREPSPSSSSSSGHSNPNQAPTRNQQVLDQLAVERERGITVKAVAVSEGTVLMFPVLKMNSMFYTSQSGITYLLNLIDTPGHVDFTTEVLRSLSATQGAILLVDATQGVQAQTLAVLQAARRRRLRILPVLNKLDLPSAEPEKVASQVAQLLIDDSGPANILKISAKTGRGVDHLLESLVAQLPPPVADPDQPLRAFVFDSWFDHFQGVVSLVSIADGRIKKGFCHSLPIIPPHFLKIWPSSYLSSLSGDKIKSFKTGKTFQGTAPSYCNHLNFLQSHLLIFVFLYLSVSDCGIMHPHQLSLPSGLHAGQCGWLTCAMKNAKEAILGDTFYAANTPPTEIKPVNQSIETRQSMVFAGLYPIDSNAFDRLADAIQRLVLNDRSVTVNKESSVALGQGFRLGFLGTLHMDVFRQRLTDEYASEVIITRPFVPLQRTYRVFFETVISKGKTTMIDKPIDFPNVRNRADGIKVFERIVDGTIVVPDRFTGPVMELCSAHRGIQQSFEYIAAPSSETQKENGLAMEGGEEGWVEMRYRMPLSEIVTTFHSTLKSLSSGYATFDYETPEGEEGFIQADLVRVDIVVNKSSPIDAFATVVHRDHALREAKAILTRLKSVIPRQQFEIALQATIGTKIIASERFLPHSLLACTLPSFPFLTTPSFLLSLCRIRRITAVRKDVTAGLCAFFTTIFHTSHDAPLSNSLTNSSWIFRSDSTRDLPDGGHYERKMKHLQKQKEGKKKLRSLSIGKVEIPQEAFSAVLSVDGKVGSTIGGNNKRR